MIINMALSLQQEFAQLPTDVQEQWLAEQTLETLEEIVRGEWWWMSRPEQVPPETAYILFLYLAGRGCVAPWTRIYLPDENRHERIDVLAAEGKPIRVQSWTEHGSVVSETDGAPFLKGHAEYWNISLDDGSTITVTDQHRFRAPEGWLRLSDVSVGQMLASTSAALRPKVSCDPEEFRPSAQCCWRKAGDSLADYQMYHHFCGRLLLPAGACGLSSPPSPTDAAGRTHPSWRPDAQETSPVCSRQSQHLGHRAKTHFSPAEPSRPVFRFQDQSSFPGRTLLTGFRESSWRSPECSYLPGRAPSADSRQWESAEPKKFAHVPSPLDRVHELSPQLPSVCSVSSGTPRRTLSPDLMPSPPTHIDGSIRPMELADSFVQSYSDDIRWACVVSIRPAGFGPYYDMSVSGTENYLAEGFYNHNTGKTRSGSEWIVERTQRYPYNRAGKPTEHLVVAESLSEARKICVEGDSGILYVLERRKIDYQYTRSPKPKIILKDSGAKIFFEGADNPDCGRGGNNTSMWLDEVCTWKNPERVWIEGLMPSLRADIEGDHPRAFVTTTPKPIPVLREWVARNDGSVEISRGTTFDNASNLSAHMLEEMRKRYEGTNIGRQELYGEMLDDMEGALFSYADIAATRVDIGPENVAYRVVAVDPSLTGEEGGDEMGVVVAVRDQRDHMYILEDASIRLVGRDAALHCWRVFERYEADVLVFENNLGHAWMEQVLVDAYRELQREGFFPDNTNPPLKPVRSFQGKKLRAEPVSMRYQQHRIHMVGKFTELEKQLVGWDPLASRDSPDRLDAFVHACRFLMEGEKSKARLVSPVGYSLPALNPMSRRGSAYVRRY